MKKLLSLLAIALLVISCSSDDDGGNDTVSAEGTWKLTFFGGDTAVDINMDGSASNNVITETGCYQNELFIFAAGGAGTATTSSFADITLDIVAGTMNTYEYTVTCVPDISSAPFTYTQNGNTVTITLDGEVSTGTISGSTMTFVIPDGYDVEVTQGTGTATTTEDLSLIFEKQ